MPRDCLINFWKSMALRLMKFSQKKKSGHGVRSKYQILGKRLFFFSAISKLWILQICRIVILEVVSILNLLIMNMRKYPTILNGIRNNVAKGFILNEDFTLEETFVVKENNQFAHGKTLHEAFQSLQEKLYDDSIEEERLEAFKEHFKDFSVKYFAKELFAWHHVLTGSCKQGRESFCKQHGIDLDEDMFTIYEFVKLTKDSYGGDIIKKLVP